MRPEVERLLGDRNYALLVESIKDVLGSTGYGTVEIKVSGGEVSVIKTEVFRKAENGLHKKAK